MAVKPYRPQTQDPGFMLNGTGTQPYDAGFMLNTTAAPGAAPGAPPPSANPLYTNQLRSLLTDPSSFATTPGYQFIRDQALEATQRQNASQRGSFNAMAALADRGAGLAATEYGSQIDRLSRLEGQQQQYDLGAEGNRLTGIRDANNYDVGGRRIDADLTLGNTRNANDLKLGEDTIANNRQTADQTFGVGMYRAGNDYDLGLRSADNTQRGQWYDYSLGRDRNAIAASDSQNRYNLDSARLPLDWYTARTNRGSAQSQDWLRGDESARAWQQLTPRRVIA